MPHRYNPHTHNLDYFEYGGSSATSPRITPEGGLAVQFINDTGANSIAGTLVETSESTDNAVIITDADCTDPIGVIYEDGIADGELVWVVIYGIADVLLEDSTTATHGYWARTSTTQPGRADITNNLPPGGTIQALEQHLSEIGHCIQSVTAGTDKKARIIKHFN